MMWVWGKNWDFYGLQRYREAPKSESKIYTFLKVSGHFEKEHEVLQFSKIEVAISKQLLYV